jgi:hypothetical protein
VLVRSLLTAAKYSVESMGEFYGRNAASHGVGEKVLLPGMPSATFLFGLVKQLAIDSDRPKPC